MHRNPRQHQVAVMPHAPHEGRRHVDQRRSQHVGEHQRPRASEGVGPPRAKCNRSATPLRRVLSGGSQRFVIDVDGQRARHAECQRRQREHS